MVLFILLFLFTFFGCKPPVYDSPVCPDCEPLESYSENGAGGAWDFTLPFPSGDYYILTQGYGSNEDNYTGTHKNYNFEYGDDTYALDFAQNSCDMYGNHVLPIMDGRVLRTGTDGGSYDQGYGNNILIEHVDGIVSRYGHLSEIYVREGDEVSKADAIGAVGNSGNCRGTACQTHPGTHLHLAVYQNGEGFPPLPLSGTDMSTGCWYNREGVENCDGYPGTYTPVDDGSYDNDTGDYNDDDHGSGNVNISLAYASPGYGTEDDTEFVWIAVVESTDSKPDVTLVINNPNDNVDYEFSMESAKNDNPYVFFYKKTLRDPIDYEFTIIANSGGDSDSEDGYQIEVDNDGHGSVPEFELYEISPTSGEANETEFEWATLVHCEDEPEVTLKIVNPNDAQVYDFQMEVDDAGHDEWYAEYEKTLQDPTTYVYWMEAECDHLVNTGEVFTVEVE
ncbi:MAG: M23 family metallopeptidase [Candidatus Gracilibacteria bacterium]